MKVSFFLLFLLFPIVLFFGQSVEEVIVIEHFEDNVSNFIAPLYFLETRENQLSINTEKRHFLLQNEQDEQTGKLVLLGEMLTKKVDELPVPKSVSAFAASRLQFMQNSQSQHLGFLDTGKLHLFTSILSTSNHQFYTTALPTIQIYPQLQLLFPVVFNCQYDCNQHFSGKAGIGFFITQKNNTHIKEENLFCHTVILPFFDLSLQNKTLPVSGGVEIETQISWKNFKSRTSFSVSNLEIKAAETFTWKKAPFLFCANSSIAHKYDNHMFSMHNSVMGAFSHREFSFFLRWFSDTQEDEVEKNIRKITPWLRNQEVILTDDTMELLNVPWYAGAQVRWKHKKLLLEAATYASGSSSVLDFTDSHWNAVFPALHQLLTAGYYNNFLLMRFTPFLCLGIDTLDYGLNYGFDIFTPHHIRLIFSGGVQFSNMLENIQIDNEAKLGYCLLQHWYMYHFVYFCNKYDFQSYHYALEGKIGVGVLFQF